MGNSGDKEVKLQWISTGPPKWHFNYFQITVKKCTVCNPNFPFPHLDLENQGVYALGEQSRLKAIEQSCLSIPWLYP